MERAGLVAVLFMVITAGVLGYTLGIFFQAGDINDQMDEDAFFKDCNLQSNLDCDHMHLSLAIMFIIFSVVTIFIVYRNSASILTPILWYYFSLMFGFALRFIV